MPEPLRVTLFHRKRHSIGNYSIESLFSRIVRELPRDIAADLRIARFESKGLLRRLYVACEALPCRSDVLHITGDIHFAAILAPRGRVLLTIHDLNFLDRVRGARGIGMRLLWLTIPAWRAALISTVSEASRTRILEELPWLPADKVRVVHNFISESFAGGAKEFDSSCPRILAVGTAPNKNLERLARALDGLRCKLALLGHPNEAQMDALKRARVELEIFRDLPQDEVVELYRRCDLLAYVSTSEGFGLPVLEAQSVGIPVVTSDRSSMPEVAGDAACLVDPFDVESIRAGILKVVSDPGYRRDLVAKGAENIRRFSAARMAQGYAELYREIAGRASHAGSDRAAG